MTSMNRRQRLALSVPPLFLRVVLALTFLWAGLGKFLADMPVDEQGVQALTELGILGDGAEAEDAEPAPEPRVVEPEPELESDEASETPPLEGESVWRSETDSITRLVSYQPEDGSGPMMRSRLTGIILRIHAAANPPEGRPTLFPPALASKRLATMQAYTVAILEIIAAVMLLMGMLTRLWSAALFGIMLGVLWLDSLAPSILAGTVVLGFIPDRSLFDPAWVKVLWQLALLAMTGALVFSGPGALSVDNGLFGPDDDDDDDFSDD